MTHVTADRIYENTTTAGTGPVALGGAVSGYYTFSSAMATGDTCYYVIFDVSTGDNEEGIGTYTSSGNTLTRTTVLHSSNSNALVVFGSASKTVFITAPAARLLQQNISGQVIGVPTSTAGGVVFSDTTGTWKGTTAGTAGQVILSGGAGTPTFTTGTLTLSSNFTTNGSVPVLASGLSSVVAAGTTTVLTATSLLNWIVTGSGGQTYQLPSALTLPIGATFTFNNNQSSGTIAVNNNSATLVVSVPSGGYAAVTLLTNGVAAGTWDIHYYAPANVSWSTNTFNVPASITGATWNANVIGPLYGGTGVANTGTNTITLAGPLTHAGAFARTFTAIGTTSLTLPTSGTITALGNVTTGSGSIVLGTTPTITSPIIGITSFTDYWQPAGGSATQATVAFQALGTDANINASLTPKGTGAVIAGPIPDGTATGGNARGANAIDLQTSRTAAGQVATGANSVTIGNSCTATSQYDIAIGYGANTYAPSNAGTDYIAIGRSAATTGAGSVALGVNAQSAGQYSIAIGYNAYSGAYFNLQQAIAIGYNAAAGTYGNGGNNLALGVAAKTNNTTNANNSAAFGYQAWVSGQAGKIAFGTGSFTTAGDSQFGNTVLRATTTSTTAKVLTADSGAAGSTNVVNIPQNAMFLLSVQVVARETASGAVAGGGWKFDLMVSRGTGNVAIVGTVTSTVVALSSTWGAAAIPVITADTTNQGIAITVTPPNTNSTHWVANVMSTEVW